jgi:pyruvate/2-oxoglutarate dehydrogenase complex dihydrolipoamide acyltransferase (E2) component
LPDACNNVGHFALEGFPAEGGEGFILTTLRVPKTGGLPTTKVIVVRWLKREGDVVKRGEAVVELETEKVNYELDSPVDGILLKIITKEGAEVPVGDAVCEIGQAGDAIPQH